MENRFMTRIILDPALLGKFEEVTQPAEICDPSGRVLGRFVPVTEPQLSEEELQRREQEPDYSTGEVLAHLEKL
jgi:hypothetical protein